MLEPKQQNTATEKLQNIYSTGKWLHEAQSLRMLTVSQLVKEFSSLYGTWNLLAGKLLCFVERTVHSQE